MDTNWTSNWHTLHIEDKHNSQASDSGRGDRTRESTQRFVKYGRENSSSERCT